MATMGFLQNHEKKVETTYSAIVEPNFTHAHAVGQTGCGKTTSFIYPNLDKRIESGHAILLYDFKGKEHMMLKYLAQKHERIDQVVEIGKPWGAKINMIRQMDRKTLEDFIVKMIGFSSDNKFWSDSAAKLFLAVYDVIKVLEKITQTSKKFDLEFDPDMLCHTYKINYPYALSFQSVYNICNSEEKIVHFVQNFSKLSDNIEGFFQKVIEKVVDHKEEIDKASYKKAMRQYEPLLRYMPEFRKVIADSRRTLDMFDDDEMGQTTRISIIITLMPLAQIAARDEFNTQECELIELLDDGALVCINCKDMPEEMIEGVTGALFSNFTKRSMLLNAKPVSVFIDEAQRVLTKEQDIGLDVLRECRVELFLAYQNEELMMTKLGKEEYLAMSKNLSRGFYYKNPVEHKENDLNALDVFECYLSDDNYDNICKMSPIHVDKDDLYLAELDYQHQHHVHEHFGLSELKEQLLMYDARLFDDYKLVTFDIKSGKSDIAEFINQETRDVIYKEVMDAAYELVEKRRQENIAEEFPWDEERMEYLAIEDDDLDECELFDDDLDDDEVA